MAFMHLSMLSPSWGATPGICGAFDLYCLPHPREFDLDFEPEGGDVCFLCTEEWDLVKLANYYYYYYYIVSRACLHARFT